MSLSINNNITSLNAWRNLKQTDMRMSKTMEKLSSGLRINRAADDPAGLVISEKMCAQLVGLDAAAKNSEKAINMIQTAEAALDQVQKLLDKMRQLTVDTLNLGVNDDAMRKANQDELDEAIQSVTRIANYTQFGTRKLLDGSLGNTATVYHTDKISSLTLTNIADDADGEFKIKLDQIAKRASVVITETSADLLSAGSLNASVDMQFTLNGVTISVKAGSNVASAINLYKDQTGVSAAALSVSKLLLKTIAYGDEATITLAAASNKFDSNGAVNVTGAGQDAKATLTFANGDTIAFSNTNYNVGLVLSDGGGNVLTLQEAYATDTTNSGVTTSGAGMVDANNVRFQVGANTGQYVNISIQSAKAEHLGLGVYNASGYTNLDDLRANSVLKNGTANNIEDALRIIDKALDQVSDLRGKLGAMQADNLQVQLDRIRVAYENLQSAESTIRDTDMTLEMAQFTKYQIMMQAGTAMLAQANQIPNNILQLLR